MKLRRRARATAAIGFAIPPPDGMRKENRNHCRNRLRSVAPDGARQRERPRGLLPVQTDMGSECPGLERIERGCGGIFRKRNAFL